MLVFATMMRQQISEQPSEHDKKLFAYEELLLSEHLVQLDANCRKDKLPTGSLIICYCCEIAKALIAKGMKIFEETLSTSSPMSTSTCTFEEKENGKAVKRLFIALKESFPKQCELPKAGKDEISFENMPPEKIYDFIKEATLPFLRKTVLLLHSVKVHQAELSSSEILSVKNVGELPNGNSYADLLKYLDLPNLSAIFHGDHFTPSSVTGLSKSDSFSSGAPIVNLNDHYRTSSVLKDIVVSWVNSMGVSVLLPIKEALLLSLDADHSSTLKHFIPKRLSIDMLSPSSSFNLIQLPDSYGELFDSIVFAKIKCKHCSSAPDDPAICLICGQLCCWKSECCSVKNVGECNRHAKECMGNVGLFLILKKATVVIISPKASNYITYHSIYLDAHGEEDPGLERGKPLTLHRVRYEQLREIIARDATDALIIKEGILRNPNAANV